MKKISALALAAILLVAVFPISVFAAEETDLYETLYEAIFLAEESVYIESYNVDEDELYDLLMDMHNNEPMLFNWSGAYQYSYYPSGQIVSVYPKYTINGEELASARQLVETELSAILATLPEGLNDYQKALYLHDYICVNFKYDEALTIYDLYGMLANDTGVCMSYSYLYDILLERVGIQSRAVYNDEHMWNEIKIGDYWYHVDVTWDDPLSDRFGEAQHDYFLLSDTQIQDMRDYTYFEDYPCTDNKFDTQSWHDIRYPFAFSNGDTYCLNSSDVLKIDLASDVKEEIFEIDPFMWKNNNNQALGINTGFFSYNNKIYYNTPDSIVSYDPQTNTHKTEFTLPESEGLIIQMYLDEDAISYLASTTGKIADAVVREYKLSSGNQDNDNTTPEPQPQPQPQPTPTPEPEIMLGDVNGDESIDTRDYVLIARSYMGTYTLNADQASCADVNGDSTIDTRDYVLIARHYMGTYVIGQ